jgi:peptide-methionine (S)-S-oxide reductase
MRRTAMKRFLFILALLASPASAAERAVDLPPATYDPPMSGAQRIVVAGGCFWGVQGVFSHVKGVSRAVSGYAGGKADAAHYNLVSRGDTGHAESVEVAYDPKVVSLGDLLRVYFSVAHDPTQLNRQGPDEGTQYRSEIFVSNAEQEKIAREYVAQLNASKRFRQPIVTKIGKLAAFYPAEPYHQDYLITHPEAPYVVYNDLPKIEALKRLLPALYRETPVRVN